MRVSGLVLYTLALVGISMVLIAGCGDIASEGEGLPPLRPTLTAVPPTTPTPVPQAEVFDLPAVDWSQIDPFRTAMRKGFEGDIDGFVDANKRFNLSSD